MTWKHTGKNRAFNNISLDYQKAQELSIEGFNRTDGKVNISQQALDMLDTQCGFDQQHVLKEVRHIRENPNATSSVKHSRNIFKRISRHQIPFRSYHFLIEYSTSEGDVNIDEIYFDQRLAGARSSASRERSMLYHATQRPGGTRYDGPKTKTQIDQFETEWDSEPTAFAQTEHISINGMQNNLVKARWLMGAHTQVAYESDNVTQYTLFHNPSDGGVLDLVECIYDTSGGRKSHNAQQLASIMAQQAKKPTKWTVHSQGAIIFLAALKIYRNKGGRLRNHQLAIHGSGAKLSELTLIAQSMGVIISGIRNNPFDAVPNTAGLAYSTSGLMRSMQFAGLVFWGDIGESPHTLPYLGIETYYAQLRLLNHPKAAIVGRYIDKNCR